ncbi:MAG TPA: acyl carrier protein [Nitrosomonas sp.]|nr:acyl carrier protein [Nitrosomonas sp.]
MDTTELESKVIAFIASKTENIDTATITTASKFEELGFDSLDTVQLLFDAEETFGVNFDGDEVKGLRSVGDIIDYMSKHPPQNLEK